MCQLLGGAMEKVRPEFNLGWKVQLVRLRVGLADCGISKKVLARCVAM